MIIDTSALLAILFDEPEAKAFASAIEAADSPRMSVVSYVEASILIDRALDPVSSRRFDSLIEAAGIVLEPVSLFQASLARQAFRDFGRGSGHSAKLNFGDCFSYALAKEKNEQLLFKGNDFSQTDIEAAHS